MKKFIIVTFFITIILAGALGFFYYQNTAGNAETIKRSTTYLSQDSENEFKTIPTADAAKKVIDTNELKLTIAAPKNQLSISTNDSVKIAGATKKGSALVIITPLGETYTSNVNDDGSFSPTIALQEGVNKLQIHVSNFGTELRSTQREVVYFKDSLTLENPTINTGKYLPDNSDTKNISVKSEDNEENLDYQITKQTKFYTIDNHKKKLIRNSELDPDLPVYIIADDQASPSAFIVFQQSDTPTSNAYSIGEITDKSASLGGDFIFEIQEKHSDKASHSVLVNKDTAIINAEKESELSPTDIKLGDKVAVTYIQEADQNVATKLYVQHGQAAGILKDLRNSSSPSPNPSTSVNQ
jgi:hypothetical protein